MNIIWICLLGPLMADEPLVIAEKPRPVNPIIAANGDRVFVKELYSLRRDEDFRIARMLGFNATIGPGEKCFKAVRKFNFYYTEANWWYDSATEEQVQKELLRYQSYPRLIAHNLNDEPDLRAHAAGPEVAGRVTGFMRAVDPNATCSVTLAGWGRSRDYWPAYAKHIDILRVDPYPLVARKPLSLVKELVELARSSVGPDKPVISILQAWHWAGAGFPNAQQVRQMVWQSLIAGANGISFYDWNYETWSTHPGFWRELRRVNADIDRFSPWLRDGNIYPAIKKGQIYLRLWQHPERGWLLLATHLGDPESKTERIKVKLPSEAGAKIIDIALAPLESTALINGKALKTTERKIPVGAYVLDPAGRPLYRERKQPGAGPWSVDQSDPFINSAASFRVTGPYALKGVMNEIGHAFKLAPGSDISYMIHFDVPGRKPKLDLLYWHDNKNEIRAADLQKFASLKKLSGMKNVWQLRLRLPLASYDTNRDHLLALNLNYQSADGLVNEKRYLRFRLQSPLSAAFDRDKRILKIDSWLKEGNLQVAYEDMQLTLEVEGLKAEARRLDDQRWQIDWKVDTNTKQLEERFCKISIKDGDRLYLSQRIIDLRRQGERFISAFDDKRGRALALESKIDLASSWDKLWPALTHDYPLQHFLHRAQRRFAKLDNQVYLRFDDKNLYITFELQGRNRIRAETEKPDSSFLGDDIACFLIQGKEKVYYLIMNPKGTMMHAIAWPTYDRSWDPEIAVKTRILDKRWQGILVIPWALLELDFKDIQSLRMNVGQAYRVAPKHWFSWHYWGYKFDPKTTLADILLQKKTP